jgi:formate dehydrogenase iron-sulfur subunit
MCYDRQQEGEEPACAAACPYGATISGTREEMLEEARTRIADDPDCYHPHIYGEHEIGGTNVLVISPVPIDEVLGFNDKLGTDPVPARTWKVLSKIPTIALFAGATMTALWWLTQRRDEVRAFEANEKATKKAKTGVNGTAEGNGHA